MPSALPIYISGGAESMSLRQLPSRVNVPLSSVSKDNDNAQPKSSATQAGGRRSRGPAAPTGLTITTEIEIPEIAGIVELLKKLNNPSLLTESREHSNFYDFSIVRWARRRSSLVYRNSFANGCATKEIEAPHVGKVTRQFVPAINTDVLLECLTLRDVRELANLEEPTMTNPTQIGTRIGSEIETTIGSLPRDIVLA